ncbi:MAG: sigma 54-interacting transcriptional regulator [Bacillota bacterium]|nr:sigma 54-interacting transcriptional regulator [Bacillota bacterium]
MRYSKNKVFQLLKDSFPDILERINDPIIVIDKDGYVVYVNAAYEYQLGASRGQVLRKNLYHKYPHDKLLHVLKTGQPIEAEEHYNETLGFDIVASFLPIKGKDGQVNGVIGVGNIGSVYHLNKYLRSVKSQGRKGIKASIYKMHDSFSKVISQDQKMLYCINVVSKVAGTEASIMLRGETGSGKEVLAQAIHEASERRTYPFVAINCSAIPETLLESELFGYVAGAFTGAKSSGKIGKLEEAQNGTLFLDEIGDISLNTQVKLLRFTQERYIEKLGINKRIPVNVRIISATNKNLEQMVQQGEFRSDLYYRLNVVPIFIPPLRERFADISLFAFYFLNNYIKKYGKTISMSPDAIECLQDYHWPGNVRELKNVIEHAVIMCQGDTITPDDFKLSKNIGVQQGEPSNLCLNTAVEELERKIINAALEKAYYNRSRAAKYLGISRNSFYAKLKKYNIDIKDQPTAK